MYEHAKTNFIFTPKEAKLRRLLREALELANSIEGDKYAHLTVEACGKPEGTSVLAGHDERFRLGTWGAIAEALLADGLETPEGMEFFYSTNEWSHRRCPSLSLDD